MASRVVVCSRHGPGQLDGKIKNLFGQRHFGPAYDLVSLAEIVALFQRRGVRVIRCAVIVRACQINHGHGGKYTVDIFPFCRHNRRNFGVM